MATIQNITADERSIFRADAPQVFPEDKVNVRDENFAGRAWPKSTWNLVKKPGADYIDASTDDAWLFYDKATAPEIESIEPATPEAAPAATDAPADGDQGTIKED